MTSLINIPTDVEMDLIPLSCSSVKVAEKATEDLSFGGIVVYRENDSHIIYLQNEKDFDTAVCYLMS